LAEETYPRGSVVLVPFPFTDLSGRKRRPALVLSPRDFGEQDLILCAITSRIPRTPSEWEVPLEARDMAANKLPKRSVVKVGKLFTMHKGLIATRYGAVKEHKLREVLEALRGLFYLEHASDGPETVRPESGEIDEAVLALLWLNAFDDHGRLRSWKTFDWDAMDRLHERGLISDPKSKAKSVMLTDEGEHRARDAFQKRFASAP
jgi:mRNA-degrading endonuclease toxin of MazEF toxin-antitoxin module